MQCKTTAGPCGTNTVMCSGFATKITWWTEKTLGYYLFFIAFLLKSDQNLISKYFFKSNWTRLIPAGNVGHRNEDVLIHFQCIQLFLRSSTLLYTYLTSSFLGFQPWESVKSNNSPYKLFLNRLSDMQVPEEHRFHFPTESLASPHIVIVTKVELHMQYGNKALLATLPRLEA